RSCGLLAAALVPVEQAAAVLAASSAPSTAARVRTRFIATELPLDELGVEKPERQHRQSTLLCSPANDVQPNARRPS
ncbi:MAG: hypothetical protein JWN04_6444, partial [Myxococcaceae bacterium]|nr:hypothetical protein [Myxococcaceae bacterium]